MPRYSLGFTPHLACVEGTLVDASNNPVELNHTNSAGQLGHEPEYEVGQIYTFYCRGNTGELSEMRWLQQLPSVPLPEVSGNMMIVVSLFAVGVLWWLRR